MTKEKNEKNVRPFGTTTSTLEALRGNMADLASGKIPPQSQDLEQAILGAIIFDNEIFSNEQINANVKQKIDNGFSVILYDKHFPAKDVNDAIVNCGLTPLDLFSYLDSRKFNGLTARLEFSRLSKLKNRH